MTVVGRLFVCSEDFADDGRRLFGGHFSDPPPLTYIVYSNIHGW